MPLPSRRPGRRALLLAGVASSLALVLLPVEAQAWQGRGLRHARAAWPAGTVRHARTAWRVGGHRTLAPRVAPRPRPPRVATPATPAPGPAPQAAPVASPPEAKGAWTSGERPCLRNRRKLWQDGEGWVVKKVSVCP